MENDCRPTKRHKKDGDDEDNCVPSSSRQKGAGGGHEYSAGNISGHAYVHLGDHNHYYGIADEAERIGASLYFPEMHRRQDNINDKQRETFEWLFEPPTKTQRPWDSFVDWLDSEEPTYWISGKPGSGKSVLMKYIAERLQEKRPSRSEIVLSFFFWEAGQLLEHSLIGCLRSLLWQLLQNTSTKNQALSLLGEKADAIWTPRRLKSSLTTIFNRIDADIMLIIDGLDECSDAEELLETLQTFGDFPNTKMCVSSRPEQLFNTELIECSKLRLQDLNRRDIETVIRKELMENPKITRLVKSNPKVITDLIKDVERKAEGVFLWVRLVINSLTHGLRNHDTLPILQKRLAEMPEGMTELYTHMLRRNDGDLRFYRQEAALYFKLLDYRRSWQLVDFCFAIDDDLRQQYLNHDNLWSQTGTNIDLATTMSSRVSIRSGGLLEVTDDAHFTIAVPPTVSRLPCLSQRLNTYHKKSVQFIHRTAKDYILETVEGKELCFACVRTDDDIHRAVIESRLVTHLIFPALMGAFVTAGMAISVLWGRLNGPRHILIEELENLCEHLYECGYIILDATWNSYFARGFPSSSAFLLDTCHLLVYAKLYDLALAKLKASTETRNSTYLVKLRSLLDHRQFDEFTYEGQCVRGRAELVDYLNQYLSTSDDTFINPFGEQMLPFRIKPKNFDYTTVSTDEQGECSNNLTNLLPTCSRCSQCPVNLLPKAHLWYSISATLDANRYLAKARQAYIIADNSEESGQRRTTVLYAMPPEDSSILLDQCASLICNSLERSDGFGVVCFSDDVPDIIREIRDRSRRLDSLVEAFRYMGKTEDTIRKWYAHEKFLRQFDEYPEDWEGWDEWVWGSEEIPDCGEPTSGVELTKPRRDALHLEAKAAGRLPWYPDQITYNPKNLPQALRAQE
ncbi:hypothetical protein LTR05_006978 [Lithohypha guttulata]|uniref:NACHT domain-containing protein n=1 Tax=Lithohypha guttulata TaxID=1690604 RepID=A0AAN7SXC6_9EURO|nr:hypothetical protein LTR05_006978 [Lithohypha guttulata]